MKPDIRREYDEITVVMTGGTGLGTRSTRGTAGDILKVDIGPDTRPARTGVRGPVDSAGRQLAKFNERFRDLGRKGRGTHIFLERRPRKSYIGIVNIKRTNHTGRGKKLLFKV
jgi:large subunit ribosomal protein L31